MLQIELFQNTDTPQFFFVAESWQELTPSQFAKAVGLVSKYEDERKLLANALALFFPKAILWDKKMQTALCDQVLPSLSWIAQAPVEMPQLMPSFRVGLRRFIGPAADFSDLVLVEYHFAEQALFDLLQEPDDLLNLYYFVAILYRPRTWHFWKRFGDLRKPLDDSNIRARADYFQRHLPEETAWAIVFWYRQTRRGVAGVYERLFEGPGGNGHNEAPNYFPLMRALAQQGTYGTFDKVEKLLLLNVFEEMIEAKNEQEARKARTENQD